MEGTPQPIRVRVGPDPIDPGNLFEEVSCAESGATVVFTGTVRDHSPGKEHVTHLEYEVYAEAVVPEIEKIAGEAVERWPVQAMVVEHREGTVERGGVSVAVAVACAHRADAFDAARYVIDELKGRAPIWKKEHWPGGAEWSRGS